jgi:predicted transcriptional regulator
MSLFKVFGSSQRLEIIHELTDGPMYVSELTEAVGMDGKTAAHHLTVLEDADLVEHYRRGNRKYFRLIKRVRFEASPPPERSFVLQAASEEASEWPAAEKAGESSKGTAASATEGSTGRR